MTVLFLGGTGTISTACSALAVERGLDLTLVTRGGNDDRAPDGVEILHADVRDPDALAAALGDRTFDVVVDWFAFTPEHVDDDLRLFRERTGQYVFISSASAYQTPPQSLPVTESTPLDNPVWGYSQAKIACEDRVWAARDAGMGVTVVRPSHTYAPWTPPFQGGYTVLDRLQRGAPVLVHGDGLSLWTLTHHRDFAKGFVGLLGNEGALGRAVHITTDEILAWDAIVGSLADALGVEPHIVHVPSDRVAAVDADWGDGLLGDKAHARVFDNALVRSLVPNFEATIPWAEGAREMVAWFEAHPEARVVDEDYDQKVDRLIGPFL
ncbi:NAD-dependent epimerase/dehydratase family protein [Rubrivirga marina]|uniref:NAD-dependent dehydratase n=1 Tax=Rubrivirga marina TaxID=1196024 RepID=A0A271IZB0_9BACT|nr:NAD-dependent epimerase/dehydratase family protein [Rubrivirga marina]PAP76154.1 NAD-dependent dehydratase [Rubrivirga marina]